MPIEKKKKKVKGFVTWKGIVLESVRGVVANYHRLCGLTTEM